MTDNYQETLTNKSELRCAYTHADASVNNAGVVETGHTIEYYDENGIKQKKTGSTTTQVYQQSEREWYGRINQIDETNGGAAVVGFARVDSENAVCVLGVEEEDKDILLKEAIIVDSITWFKHTGQTDAYNVHQLVLQLEVDGVIIEAASHYVASDGAGVGIKILNSGNGVTVPAGSILHVATTGAGTLAIGDDVFGLDWIIKYRKA